MTSKSIFFTTLFLCVPLSSAQTMPAGSATTELRFAEESGVKLFSAQDGWRDLYESPATLIGSSTETVLVFRPRGGVDYIATNDMQAKDAPLEVHSILLAPPTHPLKGQNASVAVVGNPIRLVANASGKAPSIILGARDARRDLARFELGTDIRIASTLTISGEGNQSFRINGKLTAEDQAPGLVKAGASSLHLEGENRWSGTTEIKGGSLRLRDGRALGTGPLKIDAGATLSLERGAEHAGQSTSLQIAEKGHLDLNGGAWVINYDGESPLFFVQTMVRNGLITSSGLAANQTIACVESETIGLSEFAGRTLDRDSLIVAVARPGDTNLDFKVDLEDLKRVKAAYNKPGTWADGDVTDDGRVDFDDLLKITQNYDSKDSFDLDWQKLPE